MSKRMTEIKRKDNEKGFSSPRSHKNLNVYALNTIASGKKNKNWQNFKKK